MPIITLGEQVETKDSFGLMNKGGGDVEMVEEII
jgi:hypothetical protein